MNRKLANFEPTLNHKGTINKFHQLHWFSSPCAPGRPVGQAAAAGAEWRPCHTALAEPDHGGAGGRRQEPGGRRGPGEVAGLHGVR